MIKTYITTTSVGSGDPVVHNDEGTVSAAPLLYGKPVVYNDDSVFNNVATKQTKIQGSTMQRNELILATHYPVAKILDCRFANPDNHRIGLFRSVEEFENVNQNLMLASRHVLDKTDRFADVRQIIPYVVISKDVGGKTSYAVYSRSAPTEERLKNQCSLGFGGHIDAMDVELSDKSEPLLSMSILNSIFRELEEEFGLGESDIISTTYQTQAPFMLLSDLSPVDGLHVGIVFEVRVQPDFKETIEHGLNFVGWFTEEQIHNMCENKELNFETWSQAILQHGLDRLV